LAIARLIHGEQSRHRPSHIEQVTHSTQQMIALAITRHNADRPAQQNGRAGRHARSLAEWNRAG